MIHPVAVAVVVLLACQCAPSRPLPEAILGEWEVLCRTDKEATASCLGKEDSGLYKHFLPGGKLVSGARSGAAMEGTWTLTGDELLLVFEGGGMRLQEAYRAHTDGSKLVLWYPAGQFGSVLGRVGAVFEPAPSRRSSGEFTAHEVGGFGYRLGLPADYRLARDDNDRQQWAPDSGVGFTVLLRLSPRAQTMVDGKFVTPPCEARDQASVLGSGQVIDGVTRDTSVGVSICLDGTELALSCSTEHTRGYLEDAEKDAALALCKSLTLTR